MFKGKVKFKLFIGENAAPVTDAKIIIFDIDNNEPLILGPFVPNENGESEEILLDTIDKELSLKPISLVVPYKTYNAIILSNKYENVFIKNFQIFNDVVSIQGIRMRAKIKGKDEFKIVDIPPNGLLQSPVEQKTVENMPITNPNPKVLTKPIVPRYITIHLGSPKVYARDIKVLFTDYIKNVASSEIYPTWPENAIRANIIAQISFTLNRIYTEWYRSRGYNFDITNSTAYDHYFVEGRNIFENISRIVDGIFNDYISRIEFLEPLLAQYCNGTTVTCEGLSQWGTVDYANAGLIPFEILEKYYGSNIEIRDGIIVDDNIGSYKGVLLRRGSSGNDVRVIQNQLNRIRQNYPGIPQISKDEIDTKYFGNTTESAVKTFQKVFSLLSDGIVGKNTWYKISQIYVGVKKLAELESEGEANSMIPPYPGYYIKYGSKGEIVKNIQTSIHVISSKYPSIPSLDVDGAFGSKTKAAIKAFQKYFGLASDGIVGPKTWEKLYEVYFEAIN